VPRLKSCPVTGLRTGADDSIAPPEPAVLSDSGGSIPRLLSAQTCCSLAAASRSNPMPTGIPPLDFQGEQK